MTIHVWSYLKEYENEKEEIFDALKTVFESGRLVLGESVKNFERELALRMGVAHGVGVNSATDGIFLGLKALGVGAGDEVITVSNTAVPTVSAIVSTGARPVFVDIDPQTYLMDLSQVEDKITSKTKCLLPVHLYGQCVDMDQINTIAQKYGLSVLEDCAQSTGAAWKSKISGSMSDLSVFSFYPTKVLGTYGDGGMILTDDDGICAKLRRLRFYGMEQQYYALEHGYNSRLDEIHAEILRRKLKKLDFYIQRRQTLAKMYESALRKYSLTLPVTGEGSSHVYYLYVVRSSHREMIMTELKERGIHLNISYPFPIHTMSAYENLGYKRGDLPVTEKAQKEIFSLPMYPTLTDGEHERVCESLVEILSKIG